MEENRDAAQQLGCSGLTGLSDNGDTWLIAANPKR
jgi:hypothetical protein